LRMVIYDKFGRPVRGVRISVTNNCSFRCIFCHREGQEGPSQLMSPEEIGRVVSILRRFGVEYVKLTGGEPMLRNDIVEIVRRVKSAGVREVSMTSNGTRIADLAHTLREAGLNRVNISLHSLRRRVYREITGVDRLDQTLRAVEAAIEAGLRPVKLNVVVLRGLNDGEIWDLVEFSRSLGGGETNVLQLIELLDTGDGTYDKYHVDLGVIEEEVRRRAVSVRYRRLHNRPVYTLPNGVVVEFVKPMHNHAFCMGDGRIRITCDGKFKPCLMRNDNLVDFLSTMRAGGSDEEIAKLFLEAVRRREPYFAKCEGGHVDRSTCLI